MSSKLENAVGYPEHEKLKAVMGKSQCCGEFLEHLFSKGYYLAKYRNESLVAENRRIEDLLAEFFEIDLKKLEEEKLAMVEECRAMQNRRTS